MNNTKQLWHFMQKKMAIIINKSRTRIAMRSSGPQTKLSATGCDFSKKKN
jgi:hypothetical protein